MDSSRTISREYSGRPVRKRRRSGGGYDPLGTSTEMAHIPRRANATQASDGTQRVDLAVSLTGHYMREPLPNHATNETILALPQSTDRMYSKLEGLENEKWDDAFRNTLNLTSAERRSMPIADTKRFLIVGYALRRYFEPMKRRPLGAVQAGPIGTEEPDANDDNIWEAGQTLANEAPVLVVVPLKLASKSASPLCKLYGLIFPANGVSKPLIISQDLVFFRHEFRTNATSNKGREKEWIDLINAAVLGYQRQIRTDANDDSNTYSKATGGAIPYNNKHRLSSARDLASTTKKHSNAEEIPPTMKTEVVLIEDEPLQEHGGEALGKTALQQEGLVEKPCTGMDALKLFCEGDRDLSIAEARNFLIEAQKWWLSIYELTPPMLQEMKQAAMHGQVIVPRRFLGLYLRFATRHRSLWMGKCLKEQVRVLTGLLGDVQFLVPNGEPGPPFDA